MNNNLFQGELVHLKAVDAQVMAEAFSRWAQDSEYWRLLASDPSHSFSVKSTKEWLEKEQSKDPPGFYMFAIHTLDDDKLIGEIGLDAVELPHMETFVGIGLGERETWGKGYGTDAMRIILRYAFTEMNLHRLSLTVFEYNPRAIKSYIKAGFVEEGRVRGFLHRAGRRYDLIFMGILREEWEKIHGYNSS